MTQTPKLFDQSSSVVSWKVKFFQQALFDGYHIFTLICNWPSPVSSDLHSVPSCLFCSQCSITHAWCSLQDWSRPPSFLFPLYIHQSQAFLFLLLKRPINVKPVDSACILGQAAAEQTELGPHTSQPWLQKHPQEYEHPRLEDIHARPYCQAMWGPIPSIIASRKQTSQHGNLKWCSAKTKHLKQASLKAWKSNILKGC